MRQTKTMSSHAGDAVKILVVIASYGSANDRYLSRVLAEYRSMPYATDIVVLSNAPKDLGSDVKVIVGLPNRQPWSLPFGHKQIFADRVNAYDLFVYSEDDMLITERNIEAFRQATAVLQHDEIAGFLRFERLKQGTRSYPDVHLGYHWDVQTVRSRGERIWAFFTNEHAASYILTRSHLQRAIDSGGFLVEPHEGEYDLLCAAATDPYTQCGMQKLICVSHIDDFLIHHLPNKYVGKLGVGEAEFDAQVAKLVEVGREDTKRPPLLSKHSTVKATHFSKNYYEPIRNDLIELIPAEARSILSIGCGWGATEKRLMLDGKKVVGVGLDPVISACARARGVEVVEGDLPAALAQLRGNVFDCILLSNILHLVGDPRAFLQSLGCLMSDGTTVITAVPNLSRLPVRWRTYFGKEVHRALGNFARSGVQFTSHRAVREWHRGAGLEVDCFADVIPQQMQTLCAASGGVLAPLLSSEIVAVATLRH
jgi:2-polyprenyl-3-methyl-5-hydroxy-6-metoxy-1,4-benzoquinol methylase